MRKIVGFLIFTLCLLALSSCNDEPLVGTAEFSIAPDRTVTFAEANLQYNDFLKEWRFAERPWVAIADSNRWSDTVALNTWIDMFGWGSGNNPVETSKEDEKYSTFVDWGAVCGLPTPEGYGAWRTLNADEWDYVLFKRNTASGIRYSKSTIEGKRGLIVVPDNWDTTTYALDDINAVYLSFTEKSISAAVWDSILAPAGCVFLPVTGDRFNDKLNYTASSGYYWTSTKLNSSCASTLYFTTGYMTIAKEYLCRGMAVRLAADKIQQKILHDESARPQRSCEDTISE